MRDLLTAPVKQNGRVAGVRSFRVGSPQHLFGSMTVFATKIGILEQLNVQHVKSIASALFEQIDEQHPLERSKWHSRLRWLFKMLLPPHRWTMKNGTQWIMHLI
jgi:hypothetical protein